MQKKRLSPLWLCCLSIHQSCCTDDQMPHIPRCALLALSLWMILLANLTSASLVSASPSDEALPTATARAILVVSYAQVTATPVATPEPDISITMIELTAAGTMLTVAISTQDTSLIDRYIARLKTSDGTQVSEMRVETPPHDMVTLPIEDLETGDYDVELTALDSNGDVIASTTVPFRYVRPVTSTPFPTPVPRLPPQRMPNPLIVFGGVILLSLVGLVWVVRRFARNRQ